MGGIRSVIPLALLLAAGCKDKTETPTTKPTGSQGSAAVAGPPTGSATKPADPPSRVAVGNCHAGTGMVWVSGPDARSISGFGFGRSGFGPGSGTGWGTIGTGRYGTIGPGGGSGFAGAPRRGNMPSVSIGQPNATGDLDKAIIRRYIKRNIAKITYCYEKQLLVSPDIGGTVNASFFIRPDGVVGSSKAKGVHDEVAMCLANVIAAIEFPKPKGGGGVQVNYPFTFRKADDTEGKPVANLKDQVSTTKPPPMQPQPPPEPADDDGGTGTAMALEEGKMGQIDARQEAIDQARKAGILGTLKGDPGDDGVPSLLEGKADALTACLAKQNQPYGAFLVELGPDGGAAPSVKGIDGDAAACVVALAATVKSPPDKPRTTAMTCPVSFGTLPIATAHGVDVTADDVKYDGVKVASAIDISSVKGRIEALLEVASKYERATKELKDAVSVRGPAIVRIADATPMVMVNAVIVSMKLAAEPHLVAVADGKSWKLERTDVQLPAPPLPVGHGGDWAVPSHGSDEVVVLSVLVDEKKIWVGLSRVNEMEQIDIDGNVGAALDKVLSKHKATAFFTDRKDAELAGADTVKFEVVRSVRDAMVKAGFVDVEVTTPAAMTVHFQQ